MSLAAAILAAVPILGGATPSTGPQATVVGPPEVVFDWTTDRCETEDIPDGAAHAFRDVEGRTQLIAAFVVNRRMIGPDLDHLGRECTPVMTSHQDSRPERYDDEEWIAAPYTNDGRTIYALVHEELEGARASRCVVVDGCWMHAITSAVSTDGGNSYTHAEPPGHLVAAMPFRYRANSPGFGYSGGSNIVGLPDRRRWYFALINQTHPVAPGAMCLLRTRHLDQPKSWRAWDGKQFTFRFQDPYRERIRALRFCTPVVPWGVSSLTWNTYYGRWLAVGTIELDNPHRWSFVFALSSDLIHWAEPVTILEFTRSPQCGELAGRDYPSVIDPASPSRNFDISGRRGWLYFTQYNWNCGNGWDRDLVRVPIEFSK